MSAPMTTGEWSLDFAGSNAVKTDGANVSFRQDCTNYWQAVTSDKMQAALCSYTDC